jgi:hypothetical protein
MPTDLLYPDEIDARLNWPVGRAARLARRRTLPHYVLPDGSVRLGGTRWPPSSATCRPSAGPMTCGRSPPASANGHLGRPLSGCRPFPRL